MDEDAEVCDHLSVIAVLVGDAGGNRTIWLCANRDCKEEFTPRAPIEALSITHGEYGEPITRGELTAAPGPIGESGDPDDLVEPTP